MPDEDNIMTINERFDLASADAFCLLQSLPEKITRLRSHPRRISIQLFEMILALSDFIATADEYCQSQSETLLMRKASNRSFLQTFSTLEKNIKETFRVMPTLLDHIGNKPFHTCKHLGKRHYIAFMDETSAKMADERQNLGSYFLMILDEARRVVEQIRALERDNDTERWVMMHDASKAQFMSDPQNKPMMMSYHKEVIAYLNPERILMVRNKLMEEYRDNPIVKLHSRFGLDMPMFCAKIRKGDFSQEQLDNYFEYVCKAEAISEAEQNFCRPMTVITSDPLNNFIFRRNVCSDQPHLAEMHQWISSCLWQEGDDKANKIETAKKNQLFILYYVLCTRNVLSSTDVALFIRQMAEWFPEMIKPNTEKTWAGAIYDEAKHWKLPTGQLVPWLSMPDFERQSPMRPSKLKSFLHKMQACQAGLIALIKAWQKEGR